MEDTKAFGRHEYSWGCRIGSIALLIGPFLWSAWFFLTDQQLASVTTLAIALVLSVLMLPLVVKYFTFVMIVDEAKLDVAGFRRRLVVPLEDIVDVRVRKMHTLDSVYIRDKSGKRVSFERGVNGFQELVRFLLESSARNNIRGDERKALGSHSYRRGYKLVLVAITVGIWAGVAAACPTPIPQGDLTRNDINALALTVMLILVGVPWTLAALHDWVFAVTIDQEGIRVRQYGKVKELLFRNVSNVTIRPWGAFEALSLRDTVGNKIGFGRFLEDYDQVRRYVFRRFEEDKR